MGVKKIEIFFNNPQKTYFSGQTVSGYVNLNLDSAKEFRKITVDVKGEAHTSWSEGTSDNRRHYRAYEKYFEFSQIVFGFTGLVEELPSGEHNFQFSTVLPNNLPSTFEGMSGYIRYTASVTVNCPWRFNRNVKSTFTVLSSRDLNADSQCKEPVMIENAKYFCCLCCRSGPLTMTAQTPVRGYVPGQEISVTVEVDNRSDVNISYVECELAQTVTYHASHTKHTRSDIKAVTTVKLDGSVGKHDCRTWTQKLLIPETPPSILDECKIIDLEYVVVVRAKPDQKLHLNKDIKIPIIIGTIPLRQFDEQQQFGMFTTPQTTIPVPSAPYIDYNSDSLPPY